MPRPCLRAPRRTLVPPAVLGFVLVVLVAAVPTADGASASTYAPPVPAPVVDGFRLEDGAYGAGNRGLEYETTPGTEVRAIGDGVVAFAGPVAGRLVVSVLHPDGLRSSLTGLASVHVVAGAAVGRGDRLGTSGALLHLGVRRDGTYFDPAALFSAGGGGRVRLVPTRSDGWSRALSSARCPPACKA